jgi:hypothetical protein
MMAVILRGKPARTGSGAMLTSSSPSVRLAGLSSGEAVTVTAGSPERLDRVVAAEATVEADGVLVSSASLQPARRSGSKAINQRPRFAAKPEMVSQSLGGAKDRAQRLVTFQVCLPGSPG